MNNLKYPVGVFTHAELAALNGMEKPPVYLLLREALANGILVLAGTRPTGKRPANLYRVADPNAPVVISAPVPVQPLPEIPTAPEIPPVVNPAPLSPPPVAPVAMPIPPSAIVSAPNAEFPCPLCHLPMTQISAADGVTLKCFNTPCDPQCHENVYGHGSNAKEAYQAAKEKFQAP